MKKILSFILTLAIGLPCISATVFADSAINVTINGEAKNFDVMPIIENSRTLVPMRGIFEALGAEIEWDGETKTVAGTKGDTTVTLQIGNNVANVNGEEVILDVAAKVISDRTMVPARFVSDALGYNVDWDDATKTVVITSGKHILNGKKVLFIGNSFIYYGRTSFISEPKLEQSERIDEKGSFYQLCKANGIDVSVTNWTFGAHTLGDILGGPCPKNGSCKDKIHSDYFTDRSFDYVIFSPASGTKQEESFAEDCDNLMSFFREANPEVKFICLGNNGPYGYNSYKQKYFPGIPDYYDELEKKGVVVADWGELVVGIIDGTYKVPGAKYEYTASTFVNNKDNYHPNLLTGYITTLFTYCAITGESAVGQPYDYYKDASLSPIIDISAYTEQYYVNGDADTNYPEIFDSESDMRGLQQLVDRYFKTKSHLQEPAF